METNNNGTLDSPKLIEEVGYICNRQLIIIVIALNGSKIVHDWR